MVNPKVLAILTLAILATTIVSGCCCLCTGTEDYTGYATDDLDDFEDFDDCEDSDSGCEPDLNQDAASKYFS